MDSSATVIVNPEAARPQEREGGEERLPENQTEPHADAQADEPGKDELQDKEPDEHDPNVYVTPLNFNDFQGNLHPRYHDKAKSLINLIGKHSTLIAIDPQTREAILGGRKVPRSSIFDLMKSLYEGKQKRQQLNLHGEKEFLSKIAKVFDTAGVEKTAKFITNREKAKHIDNKRIQIVKGRKRTPHTGLGPGQAKFDYPKHMQNQSPPGKAIKVLYLY